MRQKPIRREFLSQYLNQCGNQFNCYFTIEEAETQTGQIHSSYQEKQILGKQVSTLNRLLEKLRHDLPDALVVQDASNPKIIHIINRELKSSQDYSLDRLVTLSYKGDLPGLAGALAKKTNDAVAAQGFFTTVDMAMDYITQVKVNVRDRPIREALSVGIPLTGYSRVLWRATPSDEVQGNRIITMYIQFYGPRPHPVQSAPLSAEKPDGQPQVGRFSPRASQISLAQIIAGQYRRRMTISTRRFWARRSSVSLDTSGR